MKRSGQWPGAQWAAELLKAAPQVQGFGECTEPCGHQATAPGTLLCPTLSPQGGLFGPTVSSSIVSARSEAKWWREGATHLTVARKQGEGKSLRWQPASPSPASEMVPPAVRMGVPLGFLSCHRPTASGYNPQTHPEVSLTSQVSPSPVKSTGTFAVWASVSCLLDEEQSRGPK